MRGCVCPLSRRPWSASWRAGVCPSCRTWRSASQETPAALSCSAPPLWPRAWMKQTELTELTEPASPRCLAAREAAPSARTSTTALSSWMPAGGRSVWQRGAQPTTTLWFMWRALQVTTSVNVLYVRNHWSCRYRKWMLKQPVSSLTWQLNTIKN